jgi:hypothetical protein
MGPDTWLLLMHGGRSEILGSASILELSVDIKFSENV